VVSTCMPRGLLLIGLTRLPIEPIDDQPLEQPRARGETEAEGPVQHAQLTMARGAVEQFKHARTLGRLRDARRDAASTCGERGGGAVVSTCMRRQHACPRAAPRS